MTPTPYRVPRHPAPIDLRLDGNEGAGPPDRLHEALAPLMPDVVRTYPDARPLEAELARRLGIAPERVLVTAGADEALDRICRAYLGPERDIVLPEPTFEMLVRYAQLARANVVSVPWMSGPYPVDVALEACSPRTAVVAVVTPNNPTGQVARAEDLARLSARAPRALLLVDLAYTEFADEDLTPAALALPNGVVTRTLSKAWGLAGLRVGYVAGPPEVIERLRGAASPYSVAGPSLALAAAWLREGEGSMQALVRRVRDERQRLVHELTALGAHPLPSQANFVLATRVNAEWVRDALASLGIATRLFPGRASLARCLRITCPGDEAAFERLTRALRVALRPEALLVPRDLLDRGDVGTRLARRIAVRAFDPDGGIERARTSSGFDRAWVLGTTTDHLREARRQGCVPIALAAADGAFDAIASPLAARVLRNVEDVEELLP